MSTNPGGVVTGVAAGVPFLAVPPAEGARPDAPVVVAWHMMDPPRTEAAFAAALPLAGLDAWRIYLGLPMTGARLPEGGFDELFRLASEDAVLKMHGPVVTQAIAELPAALAEIRGRLGIANEQPVALVGGSIGAAVALLTVADRVLPVGAAVLISPVVQLRATIEALSRRFGVTYEWSPPSDAIATRLDFVARADDIAAAGAPPTLAIVGADDDGFLEPAEALHGALTARSVEADLVVVPGMGHALAEEPGVERAPQTPHAAEVDRRTVEWLRRYLSR